ncbi:hypothetical protein ARC78_11575 [Stenotrophomonas pictorum JCM 9942]|uniref:Secreted protein n=1 Tax=Stenotrophomonas pictorum JCM 9942 TaxID=1236960 RepID=A0A0R0AH58_9GAMM|nr:hypothetical protein [Stenotrophomonas pictorum]KRG41226.1 hypothetical protein ARC78_11575 [Stenotrophomonas pictorum JCM 9942]
MKRLSLCLLLCLVSGNSAAATAIDLPALIECRQSVSDFTALAPIANDPLKAVALGWRPLPQGNLFMAEYRLNTPITVFGRRADHIAMAGATIVAILDLPDPRELARELDLESAVDTPDKAMFGRELVSRDVIDARTGEALIESVILSVSNVKSHPGKTLAGCTYSLDIPAEDEAPEAPQKAPAAPSPA